MPNSGNTLNGLFLSGQGIAKTTYTWPALAVAPRFGMAYDVTGQQKMVLRGGAGLFFDRPSGNSIYSQVQNPPTYTSITVRNAQLQTLANAGTIAGAPALNVFEYAGNLPSSTQWNGGLQMALPWSSALDVEYVGQHSFNTLDGVDINAIDFGAAFLPQNQDPTLAVQLDPGRDGGGAGSDAGLSWLCRDYPAVGPWMADVPLVAAVVQPAFQGRSVVRLQRHDRPLR